MGALGAPLGQSRTTFSALKSGAVDGGLGSLTGLGPAAFLAGPDARCDPFPAAPAFGRRPSRSSPVPAAVSGQAAGGNSGTGPRFWRAGARRIAHTRGPAVDRSGKGRRAGCSRGECFVRLIFAV